MPITASAKKKMRQDKKRQTSNERRRATMKKTLRTAKRNPTAKHIQAAYAALDAAAKKRVIHRNKAARLKSRLSKFKNKSLSRPKSRDQKRRSRPEERSDEGSPTESRN